MKFSQLAVSAFLASAAVAVPVAAPDVVTVVETAQEVAYVTDVQNVYVTVAAGQEPSAVASAEAAPSAEAADNSGDGVTYVEATVYVDQFGNAVTPDAESAAPATSSQASSKSQKGHGHRHKHKTTLSSVNTAPTPSASSDIAVVTVTSASPVSSAEPTSSSAPVTSQVEVESSAPAPAPTSSSTPNVVVVTVSPDAPETSAPASVTSEVPETSTPAPATSTVEEASTSSASPADVAQSVETAEDSAASVTTSGSSDLDSFASSCVDLHNSLRAKHSAPALTWNTTLSDYAQSYLSKQNCVFEHSNGPYGENIAMGYSDPTKAIQAWYDEVKDYDYSTGTFSMSTGHFTQLVWKDTTQIGCSKVDCGSSGAFFACEYFPYGNVIGFFIENVLP